MVGYYRLHKRDRCLRQLIEVKNWARGCGEVIPSHNLLLLYKISMTRWAIVVYIRDRCLRQNLLLSSLER